VPATNDDVRQAAVVLRVAAHSHRKRHRVAVQAADRALPGSKVNKVKGA
jgi:hypothetical protein